MQKSTIKYKLEYQITEKIYADILKKWKENRIQKRVPNFSAREVMLKDQRKEGDFSWDGTDNGPNLRGCG
jgi:hypothetical protein